MITGPSITIITSELGVEVGVMVRVPVGVTAGVAESVPVGVRVTAGVTESVPVGVGEIVVAGVGVSVPVTILITTVCATMILVGDICPVTVITVPGVRGVFSIRLLTSIVRPEMVIVPVPTADTGPEISIGEP